MKRKDFKGTQIILFVMVVMVLMGGSVLNGEETNKRNRREIKVTRWKDPDGNPRPLHEPVIIHEKLQMNYIESLPAKGRLSKGATGGRICIVVHQDIYNAISSGVTQYENDLTDAGFSVVLYTYASGGAESLRNYLAGLYNDTESLAGAVLIGNIPYIVYEMMELWYGETVAEYEDFPCDLFYMDLDGTWSDTLSDGQVQPGNGKYDTWSGEKGLEIWVSRMKTDNLTRLGTETDILNTYFDKNHRYRTGSLKPAQKCLAYIDDDWQNHGPEDAGNLGMVYGSSNVTTITDREATTAADYKTNHMPADYEFIFLRSHGFPGGHGFYRNSGSVFDYIYCRDYRDIDPGALFYSFFVCSGSDFTAVNYLAGTAAFNTADSGLLCWGSTKTGGMLDDVYFYNPLASGEVFGEAFRQWFNIVRLDDPSFVEPWYYGMVMIGDGALRPVSGGTGGSDAILQVSETNMYFGASVSGAVSPSQSFLINNTGSGTMNWGIGGNADWLACSPVAGSGAGTVTVSVNAGGLSAGTYTGVITVTAPGARGTPKTIEVTLTVYAVGQDAVPFGTFETPVDNATVRSNIPVSGWVLDDIGVEKVEIYRSPVTGEGSGWKYIGDAVLVEGARPDVAANYPTYPNNSKAGWGYMLLTNFLPYGGNGTFVLHAVATDATGHAVTLGSKTIFCDNANAVKPFGTLDTPMQGGVAFGDHYLNWGWVLTPQPNHINPDGSTIGVYIDGQYIGHPVYDLYRNDIATLFPGYANTDGAVGIFYIDTTAYANGVHSIAWNARDSAGNIDGIGSRYFTINNSSSDKRKSGVGSDGEDFVDNAEIREFLPGDSWMDVTIEELERLEVRFGGGIERIERVESINTLPTGSSLDGKKGIFYWQPGPGFLGNYQLEFLVKDKDHRVYKKSVSITIKRKQWGQRVNFVEK